MPTRDPVIVWFRQDLRITDNPALCAAVRTGSPILPIYVLDDENAGAWAMGGASRWWLQSSLSALDRDLGGTLQVFAGKADRILPALAVETSASAVFWNRCYEPWRVVRDTNIKKNLQQSHCSVSTYNGSLLHEPQYVTKADGSPYRVFTPYYRNGCLKNGLPPRAALAKPTNIQFYNKASSMRLGNLELQSQHEWQNGLRESWLPGESGALQNLNRFVESGLANYAKNRDFPNRRNVSRLSPHLHFGEVSPHQLREAIEEHATAEAAEEDIDRLLAQIGWRDFSHNLLYNWQDLPNENLQRKFNRFPWRDDAASLLSWQRGATGYPVVDAGMRELRQTGYMHNRVRMIVGSFLVKNLLLHWRHGASWFWENLVDANLANNSASWQWIAGCGADAAPYFRIFNPVTQGKRFDVDGEYVRRFVPELAALPNRYIHCPWEAPTELVHAAGIRLGDNYPRPIVDLKESRARALDAYHALTSEAA